MFLTKTNGDSILTKLKVVLRDHIVSLDGTYPWMDSFQRLVPLKQTAMPKADVVHVEATSPEDGMIYLHIAFGFALNKTADSGCWQVVQLCISWSFAASPVFNRNMRRCC